MKKQPKDSNLINNKRFVKQAVANPKPDTKVMDQLYYLDHCIDDLSLKVGEDRLETAITLANLTDKANRVEQYFAALALLAIFNLAVGAVLLFK
jgi:hypothetical protein